MIKVVLFDFDGVIFPRRFGLVFRKVFRDFEINPEKENKPWKSERGYQARIDACSGKITMDEELNIFDEIAGIPSGTFKRYMDETDDLFDINHEVLELAEKIRKNGFKVGVLTDNTDKFDSYFVPRFQLKEKFDFLLNSWNLKSTKLVSGSEIYEKAANEIGYLPSEIFFIDDKEENVSDAKEVGFSGLKFEFGKDDFGELKSQLSGILQINLSS